MKSKKRAFTITELVIVIAVIAILAAVLIPTFSNVIGKANKSADEQLVKEINIALYNDQVSKQGVKPSNYVELMKVLNEAGFCDGSNMYMIASEIKQEGKYMFWNKEDNRVELIDGISPQFFQTNGDAPNYYNNQSGRKEGNESSVTNSFGYILSTATSGDKGDFANWFMGKFGVSQIKDPVFSAVISQFETNKALGLTTATAITNWYTNEVIVNGSFEKVIAPVYTAPNGQKISEWNKENFTSIEDMQAQAEKANKDAAVEAGKYLMGVVSLVNNGISMAGIDLAVVPVEVVVADDGSVSYQAGAIDLTDATWTPIADQPRKTANLNGTFQGALDLGYTDKNGKTTATTIKGLKIHQNYVNNSAELQTMDDAGLTTDGYMFNYGLFAFIASTKKTSADGKNTYSIPAAVKNITLVDIDLDLTKATITKGGKTYPCFTDCAGIVAGHVVGDVIFENINVGTESSPAKIKAFDGVGVLVGRHYGDTKTTNYANNEGKDGYYQIGDTKYYYNGKTFVATNCNIYANVEGDRRSGGIIGYTANVTQVILDNVTANVSTTQNMSSTKGATVQTGVLGYISTTAIIAINNSSIDGSSSFGNLYTDKKNPSGTKIDPATLLTDTKSVYKDSYNKILVGGANALSAHRFVVTGSSIFGTSITSAESLTAAAMNEKLK